MEGKERLMIEQQAVEALRESSRSLKVAEQLLSVGNITEAQRLRDKAREKRDISIWLMKQARSKDH